MRHVISLSTIPPRFDRIGPALAALVRQRSRPEAVELYIPRSYRRFPQWGGALPQVPEGVTIVRVDDDLGPATKVLPAARTWRGQGVELSYVDDDHVFAPDWAGRVLALRRQRPDDVLCAFGVPLRLMGSSPNPDLPEPQALRAPRSREQLSYQLRRLLAAMLRSNRGPDRLQFPFRKIARSGYADIALGFCGVSIRPEFLDDLAYDIPPVLWAVDDIWLSGHFARRGVAIWADISLNRVRTLVATSATQALMHAQLDGADRNEANLACIAHMRQTYGVWGGIAAQST